MNRPPLDIATLSLGLACLGFACVVLLGPAIAAPAVQPILALILAAAGTIGLLLNRGRRTPGKTQRKDKELP